MEKQSSLGEKSKKRSFITLVPVVIKWTNAPAYFVFIASKVVVKKSIVVFAQGANVIKPFSL